ncbi:MAG: DUF5123 domain-containing protein [Niabella sp. SCN 42-15]|nr:MAG: DUF5123 domain-containing protein [Niabella sp. SCN 42-15]
MKPRVINLSVLILCCASLLLAGCSKNVKDEITSLNFSRLMSPSGVTAVVVNRTSVRLNWNKVTKAQGYAIEFFNNGTMDFSGTPVRTVSNVAPDAMPYTVPGLVGETTYSVRIKAVGEGVDDSKWSAATFTTDAEQIFLPVDPNDIQAKQVTLRWQAGQTATQIVLQPGNITHTVTPSEIANGVAVITGLTPETAYTAKLLSGVSTRGTATFSTLIDLGGAIQVNPGDDLTAILQAANAGDVFALMPGEYITQDIAITKSIAIKGARPADKPVLKGTIFRISDNAGLELKDLILDGTGALNDNQAIIYSAGSVFAPLSIEDCTIKNYVKGIIYVNSATRISSVVYKGNIIQDIQCNGGDFIDFRNGLADKFDFINNTVSNSATARDFFRMDAGGTTNFPGVRSVITINNNTFFNICQGTSNRVLYIRLANGSHEIKFNKNIIAGSNGQFTNQSATNVTERGNNNYFQAPNYYSTSVTNSDRGVYTTLDPGFANPATGNFTVSNIELKAAGIGDPRWVQ